MTEHEWYYDRTVSDWLCEQCGTATDYCEQAATHGWDEG